MSRKVSRFWGVKQGIVAVALNTFITTHGIIVDTTGYRSYGSLLVGRIQPSFSIAGIPNGCLRWCAMLTPSCYFHIHIAMAVIDFGASALLVLL